MSEEELQALRDEVADLTARRDIEKAARNYMRGQDRLLPALHLSAFHDDAWVDCGLYAGSAAGFVDFAQGFLANFDSSQHLIGQIDIQLNGNRATGEVYFIAHHRTTENDEKYDLFVAGRYHDEYENRGDGWKIALRKEIVDWVRTDPSADSFLAGQPALHLAARGESG
ncbi:nuclear transport factor 2 family protein [Pseudomonas sp. OIL-1]|uniref:nuclear transport factor 2 family protein n=1 Tax=Pseudomonas sp. OIL-1 TaxID=2706126 RepID=UPI0013A799CE|nr:nuclear transport factor 2 family protein [Pseudomonas sp. OIL-1]QIB49885.1 nuclear transport factor 2 family protein [Pseudomonas sp. OIL-1]